MCDNCQILNASARDSIEVREAKAVFAAARRYLQGLQSQMETAQAAGDEQAYQELLTKVRHAREEVGRERAALNALRLSDLELRASVYRSLLTLTESELKAAHGARSSL